jgi:hypothetical protein
MTGLTDVATAYLPSLLDVQDHPRSLRSSRCTACRIDRRGPGQR